MKANFRLLCLALMLILMGVTANSCNDRKGLIIRVNRHGQDYREIGTLASSVSWLGFIEYCHAGLLPTANEKVLLLPNHFQYDTRLMDYFGHTQWSNQAWGGARTFLTWDGNYIFQGSRRRHVANMDILEYSFPDSSYLDSYISAVSDDNRYISLNYINNSLRDTTAVMIWDDINKTSRTLKFHYESYSGRGIYVPHLDQLYYLGENDLRMMNPDGSAEEVVLATPGRGGTNMILLPGANTLLVQDGFEYCVLDIPQNTVRHRICINPDNTSIKYNAIAYAPFSNELFYVLDNAVWCHNIDENRSTRVYRGSKNGVTIAKGFACSWDGNYLFMGALK